MASIIELLEKKGWSDRILLWLITGLLPYVIGQILLTGISNKSLEILRNGVHLKLKNKLRKKYASVLDNFDKQYKSPPKESSNKVWICWLQGMENAPLLVQKCYESIITHLKDRQITLITSKNRKEYVTIPEQIEKKYEKGIITHAHFSDILRISLLAKYGGTWIDATVFCSGGEIPTYMLNSSFFIFQNLKPGSNGQVSNISNWFITAQQGNKFIMAMQTLLYTYWERHDYAINYFFFHLFVSIIADRYSEDWKQIVKYPNSFPHVLQISFFEPYNKLQWEELKRICPFHKLSYKLSEEKFTLKGTYYDVLFNGK